MVLPIGKLSHKHTENKRPKFDSLIRSRYINARGTWSRTKTRMEMRIAKEKNVKWTAHCNKKASFELRKKGKII